MKHARKEKLFPDGKRILRIALSVLLILVPMFGMTHAGERFWNAMFLGAKLSHFTSDLPEDRLHIHVLDVGKADCILIESPSVSVLVDTGTAAGAENVLRFLRARDIDRLDAVILSHGDSDHAGGFVPITESVPADVLYGSMFLDPGQTDIPLQQLSPGETLTVGDLTLEVLGPVREYPSENENSLVFRLHYGDFSMLFCGDMESGAEKDLMESGADLRADVLKVAHHGSAGATSGAFLEAVGPEIGVISSGRDRSLLPRNAVLKRLSDAGTEIYRTDRHGSVVLSADTHGNIQVLTENAG